MAHHMIIIYNGKDNSENNDTNDNYRQLQHIRW